MKKLSLLLASILCLSLLTVGLVACKDVKLTAPTTLEYDGTTISWSAVENCDGYYLTIDENKPMKIITNTHIFDAKGKSFMAKIRAYGMKNNEEKLTEELVMTFSPLATITELTTTTTSIKWEAVDGATGYEVRINNGTPISVATNEFTEMPVGNFSFQVKATGSMGTYSKYSDAKSYKKLETPTNLSYNGERISWRAVSGAQHYELTINGITSESTSTFVNYLSDVDVAFSVKAVGNGVFESTPTEEIKYRIFPIINTSDISVLEGAVTWPSIPNADAYIVDMGNNQLKEVKNNVFADFITGKQNSIKVRAISKDENFFSKFGDAFNFCILSSPEIVYSLGDEAIADVYFSIKDDITLASSYRAKIKDPSGETFDIDFSRESNSFSRDFAIDGEYLVSVCALALANSDNYDSSYSSPIKVVRQAAPTLQSIKSDPSEIDDRVNVILSSKHNSFNVRSEHSGGIQEVPQNFEYTYANDITADATASYNLYVRTKEIATNPKELYLQSNSELKIDVLKLGAPSTPIMENEKLSWSNISSASGYILFDNDTQTTNSGEAYELKAIASGVHVYSVRAKGNSRNILSSRKSGDITITKLKSPDIKTIRKIVQDGKVAISWEPIGSQGFTATSYTVRVESNEVSNASNISFPMDSYLTESGVGLTIQANGDITQNILTSEPSQSVVCFKLAQPKNLTVNDSEFTWQAAQRADGYRVKNGDETIMARFAGTRMKTSVGDGGDATYFTDVKQYNIKVTALGNENLVDNTNLYFDSDESNVCSFSRLAQPVISVDYGTNSTATMFKWNNIANATKYQAVSGLFSTYEGAATTFKPTFNRDLAVGVMEVKVRAVGDIANNTLSSLFTITSYDVVKTSAPTIALSYDSTTKKAKIEVSNNETRVAPMSYSYIINGTETRSGSATHVFDLSDGDIAKVAASVNTQFFAKYNDKDCFFLSSAKSAEKSVKKLGRAHGINHTKSGELINLSWSKDPHSKTFDVRIYNGTTLIVEKLNTSDIVWNGIDVKGASQIVVKIVSKATSTADKQYFDSEEAEQTFSINN